MKQSQAHRRLLRKIMFKQFQKFVSNLSEFCNGYSESLRANDSRLYIPKEELRNLHQAVSDGIEAIRSKPD